MFSAFTPLAGGDLNNRTWAPAAIDTTAELNFTRQPLSRGIDPYPQMIGAVQGCTHLFNDTEYALMLGKTPTGPWQGASAHPNLQAVFPNLQGGLAKVTG
jgi:hypothetical protein